MNTAIYLLLPNPFSSLFIMLVNRLLLMGVSATTFPLYIMQKVPNAHGLFCASSQLFNSIIFGFMPYTFSAVSLISVIHFASGRHWPDRNIVKSLLY